MCQHQACEEHASKFDSLSAKSIDRWDENIACNGLKISVAQQRRWAERAHSASVWTRVSFANLFVILARIEHCDCATVNECEHRNFLAFKSFFNDDRSSSVTKFLGFHTFSNCCDCFVFVFADCHAFARAQACRFHHTGFVAFSDISKCGSECRANTSFWSRN